MIDENITFILFKYISNTLTPGSHKKVLRICDICKEERLVQYRLCTNLCLKCSRKTKKYRLKLSNSKIGKHHSDETKLKMSKSKQGMYDGDKNPRWKGGKKMAMARRKSKRRKLFGFILHNKPQKDFYGHHLDFNHVIFIPKELHISISHSVVNDKNMDIINDAVCDWYLKYQIT